MEAATSLKEMAEHWSDFVGHHTTSLNKLIAATQHGRLQSWCKSHLKDNRADDPLLCYIHQSRHVDEHLADDISGVEDGNFFF